MQDERNQNQIIRKDARECFVESLSDAFSIGKAHFAFATYDVSRPAGQRQTNNIQIYIGMDEILEICRKLECGELRYLLQSKKKANDKTSLFQWLGGTSAEKLQSYGRARADGKSLSRTAQLLPGAKADFLLVADSGPGETNAKGLIVPRFGNKPENHVAISMSFETFSELMELFCGDRLSTNTSDAPAGKIQFSEIFFIHAALAQFIAKRRRNGNGAAIFTDQFKPLQRTHGKILSAQIIY